MAKAKTPVAFRFTDAENGLLARMAERFDGNKTATVVAGLMALEKDAGKRLTKAQLMAEIERRLK